MQCVVLVLPVKAEMESSHRHVRRAFQSKPALAVDDCRRDWDVYGLVSANHNFRVPMDACTLLGKQERNVRRYGLAVASGQRGRPVPFARNVWHSTAYSQRTRELNRLRLYHRALYRKYFHQFSSLYLFFHRNTGCRIFSLCCARVCPNSSSFIIPLRFRLPISHQENADLPNFGRY